MNQRTAKLIRKASGKSRNARRAWSNMSKAGRTAMRVETRAWLIDMGRPYRSDLPSR